MRRLVLALALVGLVACKKQPPARKMTPPTVAEAEAFGQLIATKLQTCNPAEVDTLIDSDVILARALAGKPIDDDAAKGIANGLGTMGTRLCRELTAAEDNTITYLRTQTIDATPRPLLRVESGLGINYYRFELDKRADGVHAADIYVFLSGENLSESLSQAFEALTKEALASGVSKTITRVRELMREKNWKEARTQLETLPAKLRKTSKGVRMMELQIVAELGDDAYLRALDAYAKDYPNDPSLLMVQIDRRILKQEWKELLDVLDQLDKQLGGDPYLDTMRVDAYLGLGKPTDAIAAAERITKAMPDAESSWWLLLASQTAAKDYASAIKTLEALRDKFGYQGWHTWEVDERYKPLKESAEFKAWVATQPQ